MTSLPVLTIIKNHPDAVIPALQTAGAAAADLHGIIPEGSFILQPMGRHVFDTGLIMEIPRGYEVEITPRSGLASKFGITVLNTPGTIDSDYRGPVGVCLINLGAEPYEFLHLDRIAQMKFRPVQPYQVKVSESVTETERGAGGFGSTGR